jgi:hypothetical protein
MSDFGLAIGLRRRAGLAVGLVIAAVLAVLATWYANTPAELPTSDSPVQASTTAGRPVYLGMFAGDRGFDRTLHLSGVKVHITANTEVEAVPYLCRDGSVSVTTEPEVFCGELVNPEGQTFESGDSIVLEVSGDESAIAVIDAVRLGFREGLQWGTREAGSAAIVTIQAR